MKQECKLDDYTICEHDSNNVILIIDHDTCISEIIINFCPVCGFQPERSKREDVERRCGALNIVETQ